MSLHNLVDLVLHLVNVERVLFDERDVFVDFQPALRLQTGHSHATSLHQWHLWLHERRLAFHERRLVFLSEVLVSGTFERSTVGKDFHLIRHLFRRFLLVPVNITTFT